MSSSYLVYHSQNLIFLLVLSFISIFVTNKFDIDFLRLFQKTKERQIIFFTLFLLIQNNLLKLSFYWIKDYLLEIEFDPNWGKEKPELSTSYLLTQSLGVFGVLAILYFIFYL